MQLTLSSIRRCTKNITRLFGFSSAKCVQFVTFIFGRKACVPLTAICAVDEPWCQQTASHCLIQRLHRHIRLWNHMDPLGDNNYICAQIFCHSYEFNDFCYMDRTHINTGSIWIIKLHRFIELRYTFASISFHELFVLSLSHIYICFGI